MKKKVVKKVMSQRDRKILKALEESKKVIEEFTGGCFLVSVNDAIKMMEKEKKS